MARKHLTLMVIPHNEDRVREFHFSRPFLWGTSGLLLVSLCALVFYGVGYYLGLSREVQLPFLRAENAELVDQFGALQGKLRVLRGKIDGLSETGRQMQVLSGFSEQDETLGKMPAGGGPGGDVSWKGQISFAAGDLFPQARADLQELIREAHVLRASITAIHDSLRANHQVRRHTPSISPVPPDAGCWVSSGFGRRADPFTGRRRFHDGIDIAGRLGTPVLATADGVVDKVAYDRQNLGYYVSIDHGSNYSTRYAHLSNWRPVRKGQKVKRGDTIGRMGKSGRATAPHLYYSVIVNRTPRDPRTYILGRRNLSSD